MLVFFHLNGIFFAIMAIEQIGLRLNNNKMINETFSGLPTSIVVVIERNAGHPRPANGGRCLK